MRAQIAVSTRYFADNPQVETELKAINKPAADLASQCGIVCPANTDLGGPDRASKSC